ncbi:protein kinase [Sorangium cellulosum]|uniref:non-specific serine/threonine protein kinase n=2 Tax=Sorangium cellulosum TaxID=56 RepID=A0A4P2Q5F5_SORCE|nr:serine/threonine-protein kinase [Sorangium cellulosum]AUX24193.1 protein kinase [Sorangium cellulosum]
MIGDYGPSSLRDTPTQLGVGRYRPIAKLGRGGMADVFLAMAHGPASVNKLVVVKRLRSFADEEERQVLMFMDEAKLSARMNHPNVVQTYEVGGDQDGYFIVMEYLEGQPLKRVMKAAADLAPGMAGFSRGAWIRIIAEVLRGLHYAHELCDFDGRPLGIVHRDVSPHNIFVTYDGAVKLVDFGIAKASVNSSQTESGTFKGKLTYMAPEQVTAGRTADRRADIFAVGIVLWELLAGRRLFEGDQISVMHQLVLGKIPRLASVVPGIPIALDQIAAKALEREPARRFSTAQEMCDVLESYLQWSGEDVRGEHLGACMRGLFAESRASIRQQIKAQIERIAGPSGLHEASGPSSGPVTMSGYGVALATPGSASGHGLPYVGEPSQPSHAGLPSSSLSSPSLPSSSLPSPSRPSHTGAGRSGVGRPRPPVSDSVSLRAATVPAPTSKRGYLVGASGVVALVVLVGGGMHLVSKRAPAAAEPAPIVIAAASPRKAPERGDEAPPQEAPRVSVTIASDPPDATVSWKGKALGTTPLTTELPVGTQVVVVSRSGSFDETLMLTLSAAEPVERSVKLRPMNYAAEPSRAVASPTTP